MAVEPHPAKFARLAEPETPAVSFTAMKLNRPSPARRPNSLNTRLRFKVRPPVATAIAVGWGLFVSIVFLNLVTAQ